MISWVRTPDAEPNKSILSLDELGPWIFLFCPTSTMAVHWFCNPVMAVRFCRGAPFYKYCYGKYFLQTCESAVYPVPGHVTQHSSSTHIVELASYVLVEVFRNGP